MIYIVDHSPTSLVTGAVATDEEVDLRKLEDGTTRILLRERGDIDLCLSNGRIDKALLLRLYNTMKGGKPVPKLQSKERAVTSIWERLQKDPNAVKTRAPDVVQAAQPDEKSDQPAAAEEATGASEKEATVATKKQKKKRAAKPKRIAARKEAAKSKGPRGEKTKEVARLLQRSSGCTRADILEATGWPAVSVQQMAKNTGLKLRKEKEKGKPIRYYGAA